MSVTFGSSLASHLCFSHVCMHMVVSGWRKGKKNRSGDYGPDFVSLGNVIILHNIHVITVHALRNHMQWCVVRTQCTYAL